MSSSTSKARNPYFGVEIEIFVKVKDHVKDDVLEKRKKSKKSSGSKDKKKEDSGLKPYWESWDFDLTNEDAGDLIMHKAKKIGQRKRAALAIKGNIKRALGKDHGWECVYDESLKECQLKEPEPPGARKWWGVEIISPAMAASSDWQRTIHKVFRALTDQFDVWTNDLCACHVHVSLGPDPDGKFGKTDLVKLGKGAYFWEEALKGLLPYARHQNKYAVANHLRYGEKEYKNVPKKGWDPVFKLIRAPMEADVKKLNHKDNFIQALNGGTTGAAVKYMSTNFQSYRRINTVELRRQAGAASATTTIFRVLLAVTLNVSALEYSFPAGSKEYKSTQELIAELVRCMGYLPQECGHPGFEGWLEQCATVYARESKSRTAYTVGQINAHELELRIHEGSEGPAPPPAQSAPKKSSSKPGPSSAPSSAPLAAPSAASSGRGTSQSLPVRPAPGTGVNYSGTGVSYSRQYNLDDVNFSPR
ncbi:putative amidoligase enzyme-domain-containing protein [Chaetomium sp. MPI-CAGE-AT-0009]|nr:putative amidoligase enzyme-domain-containing protein [Chaetomium sp. MPI-CAGE-AT-0009]